jgi:D-alanine-D-alanine ligase
VSLEELRARVRARRVELAARRVVVLAGGGSAEREVSLSSGRSIAAALETAGFATTLAEIPEGSPQAWLQGRDPLALADNNSASDNVPDSTWLSEAASVMPPIVFSALHGTMGEDGAWQGLLEIFGLPYASAGVKGSSVAMDKPLTKRLAQQLGMQTPQWWVMRRGGPLPAIPVEVKELVAKPAAEGSSVGVTMLDNDAGLSDDLAALGAQYGPLLIEERIRGREITLGIIGSTAEPCPLPLIEIVPKQGFYDYDNKYTAGATEYLCPADVDSSATGLIAEQCQQLYRELDLGPMARFDFILDEAGTAWFLEVNTLPGFTSTSLLPKAAAAAGVDYTELLQILLLCALERWEQKHGGRT